MATNTGKLMGKKETEGNEVEKERYTDKVAQEKKKKKTTDMIRNISDHTKQRRITNTCLSWHITNKQTYFY